MLLIAKTPPVPGNVVRLPLEYVKGTGVVPLYATPAIVWPSALMQFATPDDAPRLCHWPLLYIAATPTGLPLVGSL